MKACNMRKGQVIKLLSMVVESDDLYSGFQKLCLNYTTGKTSENNQTKMTEDRSIIEFLLTPTYTEGELIIKLCDKKETVILIGCNVLHDSN